MEGLNLLKLASELEAEGTFTDFISRVRRATAVGSAHQDLRAAHEALRILKANVDELRKQPISEVGPTKNANAVDGVTCAALLAHAIILYARATETKPVDRLKWFGRDLLSPELRPHHEEIMRYRDKALAHFGLDPDLEDGPAVKHALVLKNPSSDGHITIAYVETRANTRSRLAEKLQELISYLIPIAHERFDERISEVWNVFRAEIIGRQDLAEALQNSAFHSDMLGPGPTDFFDDDEARELHAHYTLRKSKPKKD